MSKKILSELVSVYSSLEDKGFYKEADFLGDLIYSGDTKISLGQSADSGWSGPRDIEVSNLFTSDRQLYPLSEVWDSTASGGQSSVEDVASMIIGEGGSDGLQHLLNLIRSLSAHGAGIDIGPSGELSLRPGDMTSDDSNKYHESRNAMRNIMSFLRQNAKFSESDWATFNAERSLDRQWIQKTKDSLRSSPESGPKFESSDMERLLKERRLKEAEGDPELHAALGSSMQPGMKTPATEDIRFMIGKDIYSLEGLISYHEEQIRGGNLEGGFGGVGRRRTRKNQPSLKRSMSIVRAAKETLKELREVNEESGTSIFDTQLAAADALREGRLAEKEQALKDPQSSKSLILATINNLKDQLSAEDLSSKDRAVMEADLDGLYNTYQFFFPEENSVGRNVEVNFVKGRASGKSVIKALRDFWDDQDCEYPCDIGWAKLDDGSTIPRNSRDWPDNWPTRTNENGKKYPVAPPNIRQQQSDLDRKNPYITDFKNLSAEVDGWASLNSANPNQDAYDLMKAVLYAVDRSDLPEHLAISYGLSMNYLKIGDARWGRDLDNVIKDKVMKFFAKKLGVPHDTSPVTKGGFGASQTVEESEKSQSERMEAFERSIMEDDSFAPELDIAQPAEQPEMPMLSDSETIGTPLIEESDPDNPVLTEEQARALGLSGENKEASRDILERLVSISNSLDSSGLIKESDYLDSIIFSNFR